MRRYSRTSIVVLALAGCTPPTARPEPIVGAVRGDAFSCAIREVSELGYIVTVFDRPRGLLRAEKKTTDTGTALLASTSYFSELTITVEEIGRVAMMRVVPSQSKQEGSGIRDSKGMMPLKETQDDARSVLSACSGF